MSYNPGSNRACNFKSASCFALVRFWNYSHDYSLNCTPLGAITITNFFPILWASTEDGGRKSRANATRVKAVSVVCLTFGVQNLNPQQDKALAEFLSGNDVFVNLPTGYEKSLLYQMAPLVVTELLKQHSYFPNESIVVCKIYLKKSLKPCINLLVKIFNLLSICTAGS